MGTQPSRVVLCRAWAECSITDELAGVVLDEVLRNADETAGRIFVREQGGSPEAVRRLLQGPGPRWRVLALRAAWSGGASSWEALAAGLAELGAEAILPLLAADFELDPSFVKSVWDRLDASGADADEELRTALVKTRDRLPTGWEAWALTKRGLVKELVRVRPDRAALLALAGGRFEDLVTAADRERTVEFDHALEVACSDASGDQADLVVRHLQRALREGARPWEVTLAEAVVSGDVPGFDHVKKQQCEVLLRKGVRYVPGRDGAAVREAAPVLEPEPAEVVDGRQGSASGVLRSLGACTDVSVCVDALRGLSDRDITEVVAAWQGRGTPWLLELLDATVWRVRGALAGPVGGVRRRAVVAGLGHEAREAALARVKRTRTTDKSLVDELLMAEPELLAEQDWRWVTGFAAKAALTYFKPVLDERAGAWESWGALGWTWEGTCGELRDATLALL